MRLTMRCGESKRWSSETGESTIGMLSIDCISPACSPRCSLSAWWPWWYVRFTLIDATVSLWKYHFSPALGGWLACDDDAAEAAVGGHALGIEAEGAEGRSNESCDRSRCMRWLDEAPLESGGGRWAPYWRVCACRECCGGGWWWAYEERGMLCCSSWSLRCSSSCLTGESKRSFSANWRIEWMKASSNCTSTSSRSSAATGKTLPGPAAAVSISSDICTRGACRARAARAQCTHATHVRGAARARAPHGAAAPARGDVGARTWRKGLASLRVVLPPSASRLSTSVLV